VETMPSAVFQPCVSPEAYLLLERKADCKSEYDTLLNPLLIVEVLSPSTEAYDRGEKFAHYRRLSSLQEYLLVTQDKVRIEHYTRQGAQWILTEIANHNAAVHLASIGCDVILDAIYDKIWQLSGDETVFVGKEFLPAENKYNK
jgi:Uma2 family endonuclease